MGSQERKQQLKKFLLRFNSSPILLSDNNRPLGPMEEFIITYLGNCFIQGYRIIEKIGENIFIMSFMEFQVGGRASFFTGQGHQNYKHGMYKIICIEFNEKLNEDKEMRIQKFTKIKEILKFFCGPSSNPQNCQGIQVHFIFANNFQYSIIQRETLEKGSTISLHKFYHRDYGINKKQDREGRRQSEKYSLGLKVLDQREQGTRLHQLVELFIKGGGIFRNQKHLSRHVLHHSKFLYHLDKVINTICLIIGKEMIEGGYLNMSSEKWMRKFSKKKFKKFDLLLRNQKKVCIIDWKFSRINANQKIATEVFAKKNLEYFQLARQEYNAEVQLKFYCFHQSHTSYHHKFTSATYSYSIEQIQIKENQYFVNQNNQIQIQSDTDQEMLMGENWGKEDKGGNGRFQRKVGRYGGRGIFQRLGEEDRGEFFKARLSSEGKLEYQSLQNRLTNKSQPHSNPPQIPHQNPSIQFQYQPQQNKQPIPNPPQRALIQENSKNNQQKRQQISKEVLKKDGNGKCYGKVDVQILDDDDGEGLDRGDRKKKKKSKSKSKSKSKKNKSKSSSPQNQRRNQICILSDSSQQDSKNFNFAQDMRNKLKMAHNLEPKPTPTIPRQVLPQPPPQPQPQPLPLPQNPQLTQYQRFQQYTANGFSAGQQFHFLYLNGAANRNEQPPSIQKQSKNQIKERKKMKEVIEILEDS